MAAATARALTEASNGHDTSESAHGTTAGVLAGGGDLGSVVRGGLIPGETVNEEAIDYPVTDNRESMSQLRDNRAGPRSGVQVDAPPAPDASQPEPSVAVDEPTASDTDRGAVICAVFGDQCAKALRVAECESGPDYSADWDGTYVGAFQLYPGHAAKFSAHGWDYYSEGNDPYKNATIALEILAGRGYVWTGSGGWPVCGNR